MEGIAAAAYFKSALELVTALEALVLTRASFCSARRLSAAPARPVEIAHTNCFGSVVKRASSTGATCCRASLGDNCSAQRHWAAPAKPVEIAPLPIAQYNPEMSKYFRCSLTLATDSRRW